MGYSRPLWVSTDGIIVPFCTNLGLTDELQSFLGQENSIPTGCVVHSRAALEQVGFWPENVPSAADWTLWRRMITNIAGSAAHLRKPTNLHFSASWKQSRFSGISEVQTLLSIADNASWWPSILRHTPAAEPEQAAIWRAIKAGGDPWVLALRAATDTAIDRIAWMVVCDLLPRLETALAVQASAEAAAERARAEVDALRASTSWHITAPLRTIARRLRK